MCTVQRRAVCTMPSAVCLIQLIFFYDPPKKILTKENRHVAIKLGFISSVLATKYENKLD